MKIPDSGKIVIGVIGAAALIAVLHLFLYKGKAEAYSKADAEYRRVQSQYAELGGARPLIETNAFRYKNLGYAGEYWQLVRDLGITLPDRFIPGLIDEKAQRQDYWDFLTYIEKHRDEQLKPSPLFLGPQGWDLAQALPQELTQAGISVVDVLESLRATNEVLKVLDKQSTLYDQTQETYEQRLAQIGLNLVRRDQIRDSFGELPATLYTLNRMRLVRDALPADYFKDMTEDEASALLYDLFRVEWPVDPDPIIGGFPYYRQITNLRDMMEIAKASEIEYLVYVRLWPPRGAFYSEPPKEPVAQATGTPAAGRGQSGGNVNPQFDYEDEYGEPDFSSGRRDGGNAAPAAAADAIGAPIQITYYATNATSMAFLDRVSRSRVPMELDRLAVSEVKIPGAENYQQIDAVVNTLVMVPGLFFRPQDVEKSIVETLRERYDVASRAGGREQAIKDGLLDASGNPVVPSPTPFAPAQ